MGPGFCERLRNDLLNQKKANLLRFPADLPGFLADLPGFPGPALVHGTSRLAIGNSPQKKGILT